jgi:hypothetical protein
MVWNNLGWVREKLGDLDEAIRFYEEALRLDGTHALARRNLALLLVRRGAEVAARPLLSREMNSGPGGVKWCTNAVTQALAAHELGVAGALARTVAELRWGWFPPRSGPGEAALDGLRPELRLTASKLRHDIGQMEYLEERDLLAFDAAPYRQAYEVIAGRLESGGIRGQLPLAGSDAEAIGAVYNRLLYLRDTPRASRALSTRWSGADVGAGYGGQGSAIVVVDDFLSEEALAGVRAFCLESTVWSANRYAHGRLGAFFHDGFNCPLLLQIAEELRAAMPEIVRPEYPLRQLWGFKNTELLPAGATLHADFAAVNVNFWITPESANQDEGSGGMEIYNVVAPLWWDFMAYNGRGDMIRTLLRDRNARSMRVPYRANRAIIFNSDLFHATEAVRFAPDYASHRINVTLLFGDRERDAHFAQPANAMAVAPGSDGGGPRQSQAFRRTGSFGGRR